jgi:type VI secretion system secreted protein Hcp
MAIYMQVDKIKGNVTAEGHADWIDVHSFQFGVGRAIASVVGKGKDREASAPSISEISITKDMDSSSPFLFQEATVGQAKKVTFHFVKTGASKIEIYLEYILENCMVSGYSVSSGGDRPSESLSLSFTKITSNYMVYDDAGKQTSKFPAGYDLELGKKV